MQSRERVARSVEPTSYERLAVVLSLELAFGLEASNRFIDPKGAC